MFGVKGPVAGRDVGGNLFIRNPRAGAILQNNHRASDLYPFSVEQTCLTIPRVRSPAHEYSSTLLLIAFAEHKIKDPRVACFYDSRDEKNSQKKNVRNTQRHYMPSLSRDDRHAKDPLRPC